MVKIKIHVVLFDLTIHTKKGIFGSCRFHICHHLVITGHTCVSVYVFVCTHVIVSSGVDHKPKN